MKLQTILSRLQKLHPKEIDLSLHRVRNLCKKLGNPQEKLKCISIVGTNGKYSTIQAIIAILKEANIEEIETVFALTDDDEDNIMACVLAEKYTPSKRTIAIINKHNYNLLQESLKIDDLVDQRMTTVSTIMKHVHMGTIDTVYSLLDGKYEFLEAKILESSELVNKSIKDSNLPEEVRVGAIVRKNKVMMPKSNFVFEKEDIVVVLAKREQLKEVEDIFRITS